MVTLKEVAARSGVSIATASAAISGRPSGNCRVSEHVARKVRQNAKLLRYRPNLYARRLSGRRARTVALVVKCSAWHNVMWPIAAAHDVLHEQGYDDIFLLHPDRLEEESRHLDMCLEARVDGILIFPLVDLGGQTNADKINDILAIEKIPVVQLSVALEGCHAPAAVADEAKGSYQAVEMLAKLGHRRIAHLTLPDCQSPDPSNPYLHAHRRYRGYCLAMEDMGLEKEVYALGRQEVNPERSFNGMMRLARQIGTGPNPPTAALVYSDSLAAAAMAGFQAGGLRVPDDVSIIGIDKSPLTEAVRPALGLVTFPHEELGTIGTQMVLRMIEGQAVSTVQLLPQVDPADTVARPPPGGSL
jgi:LacI family transcriptional regulator